MRPRNLEGRSFAEAPNENAWALELMKIALPLISFFSNGNFGQGAFPVGEQSNLQQTISLGLWALIAAASYFRRPILVIDVSAGILWSTAFYAMASLSAFWSATPVESFQKGAVLAFITFAAYRLVRALPFEDIVNGVLHGLAGLCAVSIILALGFPSIGLDDSWQHSGQWQGVFAQKQSLGITAAIALFFAFCKLIGSGRNWFYVGVAAAASLCVIASGSRGGGALAAAAIASIYLVQNSVSFGRVLAFLPFAMCLIGAALIAYFVETGSPYLTIFGEDFDFTERSFIWQHALSYFSASPWIGFGINGFWTLHDVEALFTERHHWFLANYHDGYIGIVMETGVIGYGLFTVGYWNYGLDLARRIGRRGALPNDIGVALVFTCLLFFIDFTELFFMRSTNIESTMIAICFFRAYARAMGPAQMQPAFRRRPAMQVFQPPQPAAGADGG